MAERRADVGYKRPPIEHRFKPGVSGNPKGRPKGQKSLSDEIRAALKVRITINDKGRKRKVSLVEALLRQLIALGVGKGDLRAIDKLLVLADSYAVSPDGSISKEDQQLIAGALRRFAADDPDREGEEADG